MNASAAEQLCTGIAGCYYSKVLNACSSEIMDPFCSILSTQALCENVTTLRVPSVKIMAIASMPPTFSSPMDGYVCSSRRLRPDYMAPIGAGVCGA